MKLVHQGMILGEIEYTVYRDAETREAVDPRDVEEVTTPAKALVHAEDEARLVAERLARGGRREERRRASC